MILSFQIGIVMSILVLAYLAHNLRNLVLSSVCNSAVASTDFDMRLSVAHNMKVLCSEDGAVMDEKVLLLVPYEMIL